MNADGRKTSLGVGVAVLAVALLSMTQWIERTPASAGATTLFSPIAEVRRQALDVYVTAGAVLDASNSILLSSPLPNNSGKFVFLAAEGEYLEQGDLLARFDPGPFEQDIVQIEHEIREQEIKLRQANSDKALFETSSEDRLADLEHKLSLAKIKQSGLSEGSVPLRRAQAEKEVRRAKGEQQQATRVFNTQVELYDQGLTRETTLDEARQDAEEAGAARALAEHSLRVLNQVTLPSELEQARLQLENSRREITVYRQTYQEQSLKQSASIAQIDNKLASLKLKLARARQHLQAAELRAPVSGIVLYKPLSIQGEKRKVQVGDSVWYRQGFAVIPDMSSMTAKMNVSESEVGKLKPGQKVSVIPEAYPNLRLSGEVHSVGTLADNADNTSQRFFEVRTTLDTVDDRLRPGMSARVSVLVSSNPEALVIPVDAVFYVDQSPVVFQWRDGNPVRTPVVLDVGDSQQVSVREGLAPGDQVALFYPESFAVAESD